jgi:hypothetical protein
MRTRIFLGLAAVIVAANALTACSGSRPASTAVVIRSGSTAPKSKGYGPPPHAPAHGYRHKHKGGVEMVYDSKLQVYVVKGKSKHYYCDGKYYRRERAGWKVSVDIDGPWRVTVESRLPGRLAIHS